MGQLRAYFDRIQGRLLAAFAMAMLGTIAIWWVGSRSLSQFTEQVTGRIENLSRSSDIAMRLESSILDQIVTGEHYLVSGTEQSEAAFDSLGIEIAETWAKYNDLPSLTPAERVQLARVRLLHTDIQGAYTEAHSDYL